MHLQLPIIACLLTSAFALPSILPRTTGWTIHDFTRTCSDAPNYCTYTFTIDTGSYAQACSLTDANPVDPKTDKPVSAATHAWYDVPCDENSDYHISWGWDYTGNFTVMTVRDVVTNFEAFFGYNSPNSATTFADVGPNAVQSSL